MPSIAIAAFYRFARLADLPGLRDRLEAVCAGHDVRGTLLLAPEGLNGTLAGPVAGLDAALAAIRAAAGCPDLRPRMTVDDAQPFRRLKVRLKREIVTLGVPGLDPARRTGTPVAPTDWNRLLADPALPVIDVRNGFEHALGTFAGALDPGTTSFRDFPDAVRTLVDPARTKAVALFCTGGIRCEKASALLLDRGFETVYQLDGGILAYLEATPGPDSLWRGHCFVFDERGSVGPGLRPVPVTLCPACSWPLGAPRVGQRECMACATATPPGAT